MWSVRAFLIALAIVFEALQKKGHPDDESLDLALGSGQDPATMFTPATLITEEAPFQPADEGLVSRRAQPHTLKSLCAPFVQPGTARKEPLSLPDNPRCQQQIRCVTGILSPQHGQTLWERTDNATYQEAALSLARHVLSAEDTKILAQILEANGEDKVMLNASLWDRHCRTLICTVLRKMPTDDGLMTCELTSFSADGGQRHDSEPPFDEAGETVVEDPNLTKAQGGRWNYVCTVDVQLFRTAFQRCLTRCWCSVLDSKEASAFISDLWEMREGPGESWLEDGSGIGFSDALDYFKEESQEDFLKCVFTTFPYGCWTPEETARDERQLEFEHQAANGESKDWGPHLQTSMTGQAAAQTTTGLLLQTGQAAASDEVETSSTSPSLLFRPDTRTPSRIVLLTSPSTSLQMSGTPTIPRTPIFEKGPGPILSTLTAPSSVSSPSIQTPLATHKSSRLPTLEPSFTTAIPRDSSLEKRPVTPYMPEESLKTEPDATLVHTSLSGTTPYSAIRGSDGESQLAQYVGSTPDVMAAPALKTTSTMAEESTDRLPQEPEWTTAVATDSTRFPSKTFVSDDQSIRTFTLPIQHAPEPTTFTQAQLYATTKAFTTGTPILEMSSMETTNVRPSLVESQPVGVSTERQAIGATTDNERFLGVTRSSRGDAEWPSETNLFLSTGVTPEHVGDLTAMERLTEKAVEHSTMKDSTASEISTLAIKTETSPSADVVSDMSGTRSTSRPTPSVLLAETGERQDREIDHPRTVARGTTESVQATMGASHPSSTLQSVRYVETHSEGTVSYPVPGDDEGSVLPWVSSGFHGFESSVMETLTLSSLASTLPTETDTTDVSTTLPSVRTMEITNPFEATPELNTSLGPEFQSTKTGVLRHFEGTSPGPTLVHGVSAGVETRSTRTDGIQTPGRPGRFLDHSSTELYVAPSLSPGNIVLHNVTKAPQKDCCITTWISQHECVSECFQTLDCPFESKEDLYCPFSMTFRNCPWVFKRPDSCDSDWDCEDPYQLCCNDGCHKQCVRGIKFRPKL